MKSKDIFQQIRGKKIRFSLNWRLTLLVGAVVLSSILSAFGMARLLAWLFPFSTKIPLLIQLNVFSLAVAMIATYFFSKMFFDPIKKLREGMQEVSDGNFDVNISHTSSSIEIREVIAGFNMMTHELRATEILQTDFVSNVSHEFKTPINAIEGYTTLLQGCENLDAEQQEYVEKILFNTKRLSMLVGNILLLSKTENQSIQTNKTLYRLDEQIRQSIVALEPEWSKKDIDFDVELDSIEYVGNETFMHHVWDNLIGNAIKFNPHGGTVKLRLYEENNSIIFSVDDCGPGLSNEAIKHVFDKFYQGDSSHKEEGNGLGLALANRIVTMSNGKIFVENLSGGGCRFTVVLNEN